MDNTLQTTQDERHLYQQVWFLDQQLNGLPILKDLRPERIQRAEYEQFMLNIYHLSKFLSRRYQAVEKKLEIPSFAIINWHLKALREEIERFESFYLTFQKPRERTNVITAEDYLGCSYVVHFWQSNAKQVLTTLKQVPSLTSDAFNFEYLHAVENTVATGQWRHWREIFSNWMYTHQICQEQLIQSATTQFNILVEFLAKNQPLATFHRHIN
ncbi:hypothetical protein [Celerinatantimonas diazotrophica]|uniref:Uncharacterized protein n=1 Tax=Celerinatantimonas diazotrophica TaxID=412034 RepID=A0A4R1K4Z8_9GAMM|nr:hypothetical protein [Celerinatantimonas diazotrophica]TCK59017.1 hypothetical protein EV690_1180 [Celerinatantimonas diazotrophica]CAG9297652.1 hypothetical protein CEDIAZO_02840 [Celerinatantimonas diazotrophica]